MAELPMMEQQSTCGCGCGVTTQVTAAQETCNCGCDCCGGAPDPQAEIEQLRHLRDSIDRRLSELEQA